MEGYTDGVGVHHRHAPHVTDIQLNENASSNGRVHGEGTIREVGVMFSLWHGMWMSRLYIPNNVVLLAYGSDRIASARLHSNLSALIIKHGVECGRGRLLMSAPTM